MKKLLKHFGILLTLALAVALGVGSAAAQAAEKQPGWYFKDLVAADFVAEYAKLPPPPNSMVIDVRSKEEYNEGHIFGSFSIPNNQPNELTRLLPKNKGTLLVFYGQDPANKLGHE
ncbi:MAG: rhodanese-like domain-containing protein [Deltaproteobacteria bacterium]|nr:rhodanese-like domain-containing protein [Deltaproteobacteria bacterium]